MVGVRQKSFEVQEVLAQLVLGEELGIALEVFVEQAQLTVVGMACALAIVTQSQEFGIAAHGIVGVGVGERVRLVLSGPSANRCRRH